MDNVIIANSTISVKEYQGQRVVTFKDIDTVHNRPDGTVRRNFNTNKKHFIEGEDYFVRNSYEAKNEYGLIAPNGIILVTESGYLMLVKSFTDDLSWDVQRELVKSYFRVKQETTLAEPVKEVQDYKYIDKTYNHTPVLTVPQYYHDKVQLLLPLCLIEKNKPDLALVVSKIGTYYQGHTCLTLEMAYNNARLIAKPESNWLNTKF